MLDNDQPVSKVKKSGREYLHDVGRILGAARRMTAYTFKKFPGHTLGLLGTIIITSILPFVASWLNSRVIDELVEFVTGSAGDKGALMLFIGLMFGVFIIRGVINTVSRYFDLSLYFDISREFSNDVTCKMARLDLEYYEDSEINGLLQKVRESYGHRPQEFMSTIFWVVSSLVGIFSGVMILVSFSPLLIPFLLLTTVPQLVNNIIFGRRSWGIWHAKGEVKRDYWRSRGYLLSETSLMELRIFQARQFLIQRVYDLFFNFQKEQIRIEKKRSATNVSLGLLSAIGFGLVFIATIFAVIAGRISIGLFNFYISSARQLQGAFGDIFRRFSRIYEHGLFVVDIFEVLDLEEKVVSGEVRLARSEEPSLIEFNDVSFRYPGSDTIVIEHLNLTINPGEHLAVVGENGAGKTTLIKLLMRFYDVTSGQILVDGTDIKSVDLDSWYEKVGTLFQAFNLYHFDAKTNIAIGDTNKLGNFERIVEAAKKAGAHSFIEEYEDQYDQVLAKAFKGGIRPSWGQWQRIALARAFFKDAPILILDEPTSAIDPKAEFEIFEHLFEFAKGKTVIIISHRFSTVRNAERIIVLDKGQIVERGAHEELLTIENGKYKQAFDLQRKGYE